MPPQKDPLTRVRTQAIYRVKTGCLRCRARKKKCDERKPMCKGCERNKLVCEWPLETTSRSSSQREPSNLRAFVLKGPQTTTTQSSSAHTIPEHDDVPLVMATDSMGSDIDAGQRGPPRNQLSFSPSSSTSSSSSSSEISSRSPPHPSQSHRFGTEVANSCGEFSNPRRPSASAISCFGRSPDQLENEIEELPLAFVEPTGTLGKDTDQMNNHLTLRSYLPKNISIMPGFEGDAFELLGHYISRTAISMSNGFQSENPFLVQLIPFAISSDLILRLMLAQSAAHRIVIDESHTNEAALAHYSKSINLFRQKIKDHITGNEANPLILAIGALILCFTETTKGDIKGTIFDHLSAATSLLTDYFRNESPTLPKNFRNFVIEYYVYTTTLSMISVDSRHGSQSILSRELEQIGHELVTSRYMGNLCGCWLELLLFIPQIFDLGRRWQIIEGGEEDSTGSSGQHTVLAECVLSLASLQCSILGWSPHSLENPDGIVAGLIFKQALLVYLYTSLDGCRHVLSGKHSGLIEETLTAAMDLFDSLPPSAQINTSLCWPLAVIGSCLTDQIRQQIIRNRLNSMLSAIGLGNMRQTLQVLEHLWKRPYDQAGPWNICRVMQDHHIWISFA